MDRTAVTAQDWIRALGLTPHPEGGHYRETYRSSETIPTHALPSRFQGDRSFSTAIYYLLEAGQHSVFHRIQSDELWHFYAGSPLSLHVLSEDAPYKCFTLGASTEAPPQLVVPAGAWFAAEVICGAYALVGCTVAPGFDFADFELADTSKLSTAFPDQKSLIARLT